MIRVFHLVTQWLAEVGAFILLPLIVYIIVFLALGIDRARLIELPEWMFISIILFGESTLKSIVYYKDLMLSAKQSGKNLAPFSSKMNREISVGIIGIVVSCVFLALTMVAAYKGSALILARSFYWLQMFCFVFALSRSFVNRIYIGWKTGEATSLTLSEYQKALAERPDS